MSGAFPPLPQSYPWPARRPKLITDLDRVAWLATILGAAGLAVVVLAFLVVAVGGNVFTALDGAPPVPLGLLVVGVLACLVCFPLMLTGGLRLRTRTRPAQGLSADLPGAAADVRSLRLVGTVALFALLVLFLEALTLRILLAAVVLTLVVLACAADGLLLAWGRRALEEVNATLNPRAAAPPPARGFEVRPAGGSPAAPGTPPPLPPPLPTDDRDEPRLAGSRPWDWAALLYLAALIGMGLYLFRVPTFLAELVSAIGLNPVKWLGAYVTPDGSGIGLLPVMAGPRTPATPGGPMVLPVVIGLLRLATGACALGWVVWGVICLGYGPRLYRTAVVFAAVTLAVVALFGAVSLFNYARFEVRNDTAHARSAYGYSPRYRAPRPLPYAGPRLASRVAVLGAVVSPLVFPAVMLTLLTRRPVKELFR